MHTTKRYLCQRLLTQRAISGFNPVHSNRLSAIVKQGPLTQVGARNIFMLERSNMRGSVPYGVRQGFDSVNLMNHMNVKRTFFSKKGKQAKAETEEDKKKDEEDAAAAEQDAENEDAKKDSKKSSDEAESSTEQKAEEAGDDK